MNLFSSPALFANGEERVGDVINWEAVCGHVGNGRTTNQCYERWQEVLATTPMSAQGERERAITDTSTSAEQLEEQQWDTGIDAMPMPMHSGSNGDGNGTVRQQQRSENGSGEGLLVYSPWSQHEVCILTMLCLTMLCIGDKCNNYSLSYC